MVQRVVQGPLPGGGTGLRVSRPGYNVLDAGLAPKQVAFDSRWPAAMRLIKSGQHTMTSTTNTIMFDTTLAVEPLCFVVTKNNGYYASDRVSDFPFVEIQKDRMIVSALTAGTVISYYVFAE